MELRWTTRLRVSDGMPEEVYIGRGKKRARAQRGTRAMMETGHDCDGESGETRVGKKQGRSEDCRHVRSRMSFLESVCHTDSQDALHLQFKKASACKVELV